MKVEAEVADPTHLVLMKPLEVPAGSRVWLEIGAEVPEHEEWLAVSGASLERAYGSEEPDYSRAGVALS